MQQFWSSCTKNKQSVLHIVRIYYIQKREFIPFIGLGGDGRTLYYSQFFRKEVHQCLESWLHPPVLQDISGKNRFSIQKFICIETYLGQGEYYLKISAKFSNNTLKTGFFQISRKNQIPNPEFFFCLKPPSDQDGANKNHLVKSVQPFRRRQAASIHTLCCYIIERDVVVASFNHQCIIIHFNGI